MKRMQLFLTSVSLAALAGGLIWNARPASSPVTVSTSESLLVAPSVSSLTEVQERVAYPWKAGEHASYALDYRVHVRGGEANGWTMEADHQGVTQVTGRLHLYVESISIKEVTVVVQGEGIEVRTGRQRDGLSEELFNQSLQIVRMNPDGRVRSRSFPGVLSEDQSRLASLAPLEWALSNRETWISTERDVSAVYQCHYQQRPEQPVMTKTRRAVAGPSEGTAPAFTMLKSAFTAQAGTFWLQWLKGSETLALTSEGTRLGTIDYSIHLKHQPTPTRVPARLARLMAGALSLAQLEAEPEGAGLSTQARQRMARLHARYGNIAYEEILGACLEALEAAEVPKEMIPAMLGMREWLLVHPEGADQLAATLSDPELSEEVTASLVHSLGLAGKESRPAQEALADILEDRDQYPVGAVIQSIVATGDLQELKSQRVYAALRDIMVNPGDEEGADQRSDAALFAVGTLSETNPSLSEAVAQVLEPRLAAPREYLSVDLITALQALENGRIGTPALQEAGKALLEHKDPEVRGASVAYLSQAYPEDPYVIQAGLADSHRTVRSQTMESLTHHMDAVSPEAYQALQNAMSRHAGLEDSERTHLASLLDGLEVRGGQ